MLLALACAALVAAITAGGASAATNASPARHAGRTASAPWTAKADPAPPAPVLGKSVDVKPVKGVVFVRLPHSASPYTAAHRPAVAPLIKGKGFVPLTETRRLPAGTQVDARRGTLNLVTATGKRHKTQTGTFAGALFSFSQNRRPSQKGLTTITLLEGLFPGAPSYATCKAHVAADDYPTAQRRAQQQSAAGAARERPPRQPSGPKGATAPRPSAAPSGG